MSAPLRTPLLKQNIGVKMGDLVTFNPRRYGRTTQAILSATMVELRKHECLSCIGDKELREAIIGEIRKVTLPDAWRIDIQIMAESLCHDILKIYTVTETITMDGDNEIVQ